LGYQILTHTHLLGESMTWNKEYRKMHQQLDQWCWISSQSSNLSRNLQESRQKLSVASSSWPIANAHKLRKQRYLFHPKERPPTTVSPSTFRKKMSVHCIKGYKICASDFARTDMKNMEARISGNVFWNHSQYVYLDPPNTPKMVDVRKLWSITQSFWIHTGIYIYIWLKRLLEADLLYHIHILRSRSAPKKSGIHGCRQGVFISTHDLTTFLHLGRTRKVWMITWDSKIRNGEPPIGS